MPSQSRIRSTHCVKRARLGFVTSLAVATALSFGMVSLPTISLAADTNASTPALVENDPNLAADVLVAKATDALLREINKASSADKRQGLVFYEGLVAKTVGPFVDFETIAFRVMGRSVYDEASPAQRAAFVEAFRRSLITTYAKGISSYDNQTVKVLPSSGNKTANGKTRAKVELRIIPKGGKPFPVVYSMYQDENKGWLLENMHLDGVNVGSTFRNQFTRAMRTHNDDLNKVIDSWGQNSG